MKFLCERCNKLMKFEQVKDPIDGLTHITFSCPKCKNRISMINNPQEIQLVRSMGINIGGKEVSPQPLELVRTSLRKKREEIAISEEELRWTQEAEKRMENVPIFVRGMAVKVTESYAKGKGYKEITSKVIDEAKSKWEKG